MKHLLLLMIVGQLLVSCCSNCNNTSNAVSCCDKNNLQECNSDKVTQFSVFDALLQGIYDGTVPISDLKKSGKIGIGTFDRLNGELVMVNDTVFQVLSTGKVVVPPLNTLTPFATVSSFNTDTTFELNNISFQQLTERSKEFFTTQNVFIAIKIEGTFKYVKTRSVPPQTKPYPSLAEVAKTQPTFEMNNETGTIVGYFCPEYAKGVNVPGFHLHYLSGNRISGGHVLAFEIESAKMDIDYIYNYNLLLPPKGDFANGNFAIDRTADMHKAEK